MIYKAFALTGRLVYVHDYPGRCPGLGASALSGRVANRGGLSYFNPPIMWRGRFDLFQSSYHVANLGDLIYFKPPIMWRIWAILACSLGVFLYFKYPSRESSKHSFAFFLSAADEPELSEEPETFSEEEAPELSEEPETFSEEEASELSEEPEAFSEEEASELSEEPEAFSEEEAPELSAAKRWQKPRR